MTRWPLLLLLVGCDRLLGIEDVHGITGDGSMPGSDASGSGSGDGNMATCNAVTPHFDAAIQNFATGAQGFAVGDLDGNGSPDVAVAVQTDLVVMLNTSGGNLMPNRKIRPGENVPADDVLIADVDGDGRNDVVSWSAGALSVNLHSSTSASGFSATDSIPSTLNVTTAFAAQLDGGGGVDLVITDGIKTNLLQSIGGASFTVSGSFNGNAVGVADVDGDGNQDVLFIAAGQHPGVAFGDGQGGTSLVTGVGQGTTTAVRLAAGKFSTDAHLALIAADNSGGIHIIPQTAARQFGTESLIFQHLAADPIHGFELVDVNKDGRVDVIGNGQLVTQCGPPAPPGGVAQPTDQAILFGDPSALETIVIDIDGNGTADALQIDPQGAGVTEALQQ